MEMVLRHVYEIAQRRFEKIEKILVGAIKTHCFEQGKCGIDYNRKIGSESLAGTNRGLVYAIRKEAAMPHKP